MATRNPFGQLRVDRDDDEEVTQTVTKTNATPLFANPQASEQKKKKKVRPDEKKKSEDHIEESNEGFEVVGKVKPQRHQRAQNASDEGEVVKTDKHANKLGAHGHNERTVKIRPGKRLYDKHSGTGRGKEVAKNGAGGKTVWGDNTEYIAKQSLKEDYNRDDRYFENALNPKPKREYVETPKEEVKETTPVEETPVVEAQPQAEEQTWERKRKPAVEETPIDPADLLERPENALSLAEYREQLKEKNKKILGQTTTQALKVELPSDLKKIEKETFGVKVAEKKAPAKQAPKKENVQEISVVFKTEDSQASYQRQDRSEYAKKKAAKPAAPKLRFEDLPSL